MSKVEELLKLMKDNPDLPIVPMVNYEVVGDEFAYWMGSWGRSEVGEYYIGEERVHFRGDDEEDVLCDMPDCNYYETKDGQYIPDLSDEEMKEMYDSLPWIKAIIVYITLPD